MKIIKVWNEKPADNQLEEICRELQDGAVMIWPTDTMYGIACDAMNAKSIERICRLKGINPDKTNLSIACSSISQAAEYARIGNSAFQTMRDNTPGPFTFLFRASSTLPKVFKGRKVVGIRIPDNKICLDIVERLGNPVMTTSIRYEDEDEACNPELIAENYEGKVDFMIDGGEGSVDVSTIVDFTDSEPGILREGKGHLE